MQVMLNESHNPDKLRTVKYGDLKLGKMFKLATDKGWLRKTSNDTQIKFIDPITYNEETVELFDDSIVYINKVNKYTEKSLIPKYANVFMKTAELFAELSSCKRAKNGAVIVKNGRIIATGFNGTPAGTCNDCEDSNGNTKSSVIHAEANAILSCAKHGISSEGTIMFCTTSPCEVCAVSIIQSGIKTVVYKNEYRDLTGVEILKKIIEVHDLKDL